MSFYSLQMLALGCLVSAAVCINKITPVSVSTILYQEWIIYSLTTSLSSEITIDLPMRTQAAAGWIIFLSIVVLFYQTFAVVQMFLYIPLLYMKIPIRKTFWYLFPLIVSFIAIFSTSYQYPVCCYDISGCWGQHSLHHRISTSYHSYSCVHLSVD